MMTQNDRSGTLKLILLAGLAGGAAEVLWVTLYSSVTGTSGSVVAQQVTASVWPTAAAWTLAPVFGVVVHMVLALALAALCAPLLLRFAADCAAPAVITIVAVMALTLVWAINFFLILPVINPNFVALMPYGATLVSKMLFGIAMAAVIRRSAVGACTNA
jgi:hypothetical protein